MKHMLVLLFFLVAGCSASHEINSSVEPPELVSLVPLPPYRGLSFQQNIKLDLVICVGKDGTVKDVKCLSSSGNSDWDTLAIRSVKGWRFTPPRRNGEPTDLWIRQSVTVEFQEPIMMALGEVSSGSQHFADSLFQMLVNGTEFNELATQPAPAFPEVRVNMLGTVDITQYPPRLREALTKLRVGDITHPVKIGDRYFIYKRLKKETS